MSLPVRIGYFLGLLAVGMAARRADVLDATRRNWLNALAFYVALPALIFDATADASPGDLFSPALVVGLLLVFPVTAAISWLVHRGVRADDRRSVAIVQSYHSNLGYLGVPIVAATLGSTAAATAGMILGVGALIQVPMTVILMTAINGGDASLRSEFRALAANPILLALGLGLVVAGTGIEVPPVAAETLDLVSATALPMALLLVGSSLDPDLPDRGYDTLGSVLALKVFLMPVLALVAFSVLDVTPLTREVAVVMFAMPTAVSTLIYAGELGGDERFASLTVFATTVVSLVVLLGVLRVV